MLLYCFLNENSGGDPVAFIMVVMFKAHKFSVGQTVHYTGSFGRSGVSGSFRIVKLLPLEGDEYRYRIKTRGRGL